MGEPETVTALPKPSPAGRARAISVIRRGLQLLTPSESAGLVGIALLMTVNGLVEIGVIGAVVPLVWLLVYPERLLSDPRAEPVIAALGSPDLPVLLVGLAIAMAAAILLSTFLTLTTTLLAQRHAAACQNRLGMELLERCLEAPFLWVAQKNSAEFARQFVIDIRTWRQNFVQSLLMIFQSLVLILFPIVLVLGVSPLTGSVFLLVVGAIGLALVYVTHGRVRGLGHTKKRETANLLKQVTQVFQGIKDIKINNQGSHLLQHFDATQKSINTADVMHKFWIQLPQALVLAIGQIGFVGFALALWALGMSGADVLAMTAMLGVVITRVVPAFNRLNGHLGALNHALPFVEDLSDTLADLNQPAEAGSVEAAQPGLPVPADWRSLSFEKVCFRYPNAPADAVTDLTFTLERGKWFGLVGASGSGKSTLVDLAMGLLTPTAGRILVDGVPLADLDRKDWRRRLAYVPQDLLLLDDTLVANVAFGVSPDAVRSERLDTVLSEAQLSNVVSALPEGLHSRLGERGGHLSGGQAQRIGLARALYRQPEFLVLDEATSALDAATEAAVLGAIANPGSSSLTLLITHRTESLRQCDEILVVADGRCVASGTYDTLFASSPIFRRLATEQSDDADVRSQAANPPFAAAARAGSER